MNAEQPYSSAVQELRSRLMSAAGPNGHWGYYADRAQRLEPTAWATLALAATDQAGDDTRHTQYASFIRPLQRADGLLVETPSAGPNLAWNGLTILALNALPGFDDAALLARVVSGIVAAKGIRVPDAGAIVKQDYSLQAWAWMEGTFSWVEPTAWCLLALKKTATRVDGATARIAEAEAVLIDRVCRSGGWNYGNSNALGQGLEPYVPTTALALLAMQDKRNHPDVVRSLSWLEAHAMKEVSAMALGLAAICLHVYQRPIDSVLTRLEAQRTKTSFLNNAHLLAVALYAMTVARHGGAGVTV